MLTPQRLLEINAYVDTAGMLSPWPRAAILAVQDLLAENKHLHTMLVDTDVPRVFPTPKTPHHELPDLASSLQDFHIDRRSNV